MRQSKVTGMFIWEELNRKKGDLKELSQAVDVVADEIGAGSIAHKLLKEQYLIKIKEVKDLENATYTGTGNVLT